MSNEAYQYEDAVNTIVYENILACHGTIAAEHGVGIIKKHWLPRVRTQAELVLMHAIKNQLDPYGIDESGQTPAFFGLTNIKRPSETFQTAFCL